MSIISSNIRKTILSETVKLGKYHWTAGLLYDGIVTFNSILHYNQNMKINRPYNWRQNKYGKHSIMIVLFFFIYIPCMSVISKKKSVSQRQKWYEVWVWYITRRDVIKKLQKRYSLSICTSFAHFFITLCLSVMSYIPLTFHTPDSVQPLLTCNSKIFQKTITVTFFLLFCYTYI